MALWLDVTPEPADYIYLLGWDRPEPPAFQTFISYNSILIASDKRRQADLFSRHGVRTPRTYLLDSWAEVMRLIEVESSTQWILKYPIGCGAVGHQMLHTDSIAPHC
jgi:hypothetical protein